jgi:outer membrane receptor protein involved in Fe transport
MIKQTSQLILMIALTLFLLNPFLYSQSKENGAIVGQTMTPDGAALPGVLVGISSPALIGGVQTAVTDMDGKFRFVALPPGTYALEAKLEGFQVTRKEGVRLSVNMTLTVDFSMTLGTLEEKITVKGMLPMVDVKDSQTAVSNLTKEMIQNIPNSQTVANIVNLAPGVTQNAAFGGADNGIMYQVDGVDVSDPELHTAYLFIDYGVVQEVSVSGVGAPAEFDGYNGAVFNTVTKTGGNTFSGMFDSYVQAKTWNSKNSDDPNLTPPAMGYYNAHLDLGGPIVKDKLWFFAGAQYLQRQSVFSGFPETSIYDQPRLFLKLTWQPNRDNRVSMFLHGDLYNGSYRGGYANVDPAATRTQRSPEFAPNISFLHIFSDKTFLEAKFAGFISYYKLIPTGGYDLPGHYDVAQDWYSVNSLTFYHAFRDRYQLNASVSHHADKFIAGSHDFKFGIDTEMNPGQTDWGYTGGKQYIDYNGEPYLMYAYEGYSTKAINLRISGYAQDNWAVSDRLTINPGIRINFYRGFLKSAGTYYHPITTGSYDNVFKPDISIAPRLGITYDIFGDHSTALKFHYGKFVDNIITTFYEAFAPAPDWTQYSWDGSEYVEDYTVKWENLYTMDKNISLPYMHQFTIGVEREIIKDVSLSANFIYRDFRNFIDKVNLTSDFEPVTYITPDTNQPITVYSQTDPGDEKFLVTNIKKGNYGSVYSDMVPFTPNRKYQGFELVLNKRFSNKWQLMISYNYGKTTGYYDNLEEVGGRSPYAAAKYSSLFSDPNWQINLTKNSHNTLDPTHMLKVQGTIILPWDIAFSPYLSIVSGNTYNTYYRVGDEINQKAKYIPAQEVGSLRFPTQVNLDMQVEKTFTIKNNTRIGIMANVFNVFNSSTITSYQNYITSSDFMSTYAIVNPRSFRVGLRVYY